MLHFKIELQKHCGGTLSVNQRENLPQAGQAPEEPRGWRPAWMLLVPDQKTLAVFETPRVNTADNSTC